MDTTGYPWPLYSDGKTVYLGVDRAVSASQFISRSVSLDAQDARGYNTIFHQLQVIMTTEQLKDIKSYCIEEIRELQRKTKGSAEVQRLFSERRFKEASKLIKRKIADYADLVSGLENVISLKKSSSRKHDLQKLMRKETITKNVEMANSLTIEDAIGRLEKFGTVSCFLNNSALSNLLHCIAEGGSVHGWLRAQELGYLTNVAETWTETTTIDGTCASVLLEQETTNTYLCPALSIRNAFVRDRSHSFDSVPILFLPLHDKLYPDP